MNRFIVCMRCRNGYLPLMRDRPAALVIMDDHETSGPTHMAIEIAKETRTQAIASIERYFLEHMDEKIGHVTAGALLGFFLEEVGPLVYNKAVADVQERVQARVTDIDNEVHEDEFAYWHKYDAQRKGK